MSMHKGMCGRIGEPGPASCDASLGDYIARKMQHDAFNTVKDEKTYLMEEALRFCISRLRRHIAMDHSGAVLDSSAVRRAMAALTERK